MVALKIHRLYGQSAYRMEDERKKTKAPLLALSGG